MRLRRRSRVVPRGDSAADRQAALAAGVESMRVGRGRFSVSERTLLVLGGVAVPVGIAVILLGWFGAARTSNVYEQIPYLISGGVLGLALVFLGGFLYFAHWLTQLVHDQRAASRAVTDAVDRLTAAVERQRAASPAPPAWAEQPRLPDDADGTGLVATSAGTLAHRPTCRIVAGKAGVRPVRAGEDLAPCRLCLPGHRPVL